VIVPGNAGESLLWERVSSNEMPPKKPLADNEKMILNRWIGGGAMWGTDPIDPFKYSSETRAGYDWWSLRPVRRPSLPAVRDAGWPRNPIDYFILASLESRKLKPAAPADQRTLIRRLSYDLLGLPPAPEEVAGFVADTSPDAYERLVDRFLKSPHYGERWGRHWLDIVRFGESQGFERDKLRPNSWPYRDWVVSALNADLPYDEFVRQQLAGDVLHPGDPRAVIATGFLVAAPWDEVGQTQQSAAMKAVVRQDELEDLIGVTGQTFMGLTLNCARCHDHKFDPISQAEYYNVAAVFTGVKHGDRDTVVPGAAPEAIRAIAELRDALTRREEQLAAELAAFDEPARARVLAARRVDPAIRAELPRPISNWEFDGDLKDSLGELHGTAHGRAHVEGGRLLLDGIDSFVETAPLKADLATRTLAVWLTLTGLGQRGGGAMTVQSSTGAVFDSVVYGEKEPGQWMAGSNGYSRWQSFQSLAEKEADQIPVQITLVFAADRTITAYRNGRLYGTPYTAPSLATFEAGKSQVLFGLRHSPPGGDRFIAAAIDRAALFDRALSADEVAALAGVPSENVTEEQLRAELTPEQARTRNRTILLLSNVRQELGLLTGGKTYAVAPGAAEATFVLARGNPAQKQQVAPPAALRALSGLSPDLTLTSDDSEGVRRRRLAEWITDVRNPLAPRVIANRLWHYHFDIGIVDTPNDFGFNGGRPSHPELLDWLASELVDPKEVRNPEPGNPNQVLPGSSGRPWSLKHLHRLIVTSATYRQGSAANADAARFDAGNRLLWRKSPHRLDAESLRDAVLVVAGEFNPRMGGPGFHDFKTFTFNSQFYEPVDPIGFEFNRRTLYRTWVRSGRNEFLDVFDCPDPSTTTPRRAVTTTPLQALALLNNPFTFRMAERLVNRARHEAGENTGNQIATIYTLALSRAPRPDELALATDFATQHGLAAFARVLFNSNEFLYVD